MQSIESNRNSTFPLAVVTGAARGIGKATAELLALEKAYNVILVVRDEILGKSVEAELRKSWQHVHCIVCPDLGSYKNVKNLQKEIQHEKFSGSPVKILINCASECPSNQVFRKRLRKRLPRSNQTDSKEEEIVEEQVDAQFSSNVLAYHFMIKAFFQDTNITHQPYIVNVASNWAGDVNLDDFSFLRRAYDNDSAYRQSKAFDRMLTKLWADYFQNQREMPGSQNESISSSSHNVMVNSCHPGDPCTKLSTALGYNLHASKDCRSSCTSVMLLALHAKSSGGWYEADGSKRFCVYMSDKCKEEREKLWEICESFAVYDL